MSRRHCRCASTSRLLRSRAACGRRLWSAVSRRSSRHALRFPLVLCRDDPRLASCINAGHAHGVCACTHIAWLSCLRGSRLPCRAGTAAVEVAGDRRGDAWTPMGPHAKRRRQAVLQTPYDIVVRGMFGMAKAECTVLDLACAAAQLEVLLGAVMKGCPGQGTLDIGVQIRDVATLRRRSCTPDGTGGPVAPGDRRGGPDGAARPIRGALTTLCLPAWRNSCSAARRSTTEMSG